MHSIKKTKISCTRWNRKYQIFNFYPREAPVEFFLISSTKFFLKASRIFNQLSTYTGPLHENFSYTYKPIFSESFSKEKPTCTSQRKILSTYTNFIQLIKKPSLALIRKMT